MMDGRRQRILRELAEHPDFVATLAGQQGWIARDALAGQSVATIARQHHLSEEVIWRILANAVRQASGRPRGVPARARPDATGDSAGETPSADDDAFEYPGSPTTSELQEPFR